jgi:hypothetical protein
LDIYQPEERAAAASVFARGARRLVELEWLAVAAVTPFLLFPSVFPLLAAAALCLLAALWLLRWLVRREPWPATPFNGALLLFALAVPAAVWASALPELTLPKAAGLVLGLAAFRGAAFAVRGRRALSRAAAAFFLLGVAIVAVGALGVQWTAKVGLLGALARRIPRLLSSLPELGAEAINPNQLAGAVTLYLPPAVAVVVALRSRWKASTASLLLFAGSLVLLLLVSAVLVLTQSRAGWTGGAVGLLALASLWLLTDRRRWIRPLGGALPLLVLVAGVLVLLALGPGRLGDAFDGAVETAAGTISIRGRIEIWGRALMPSRIFLSPAAGWARSAAWFTFSTRSFSCPPITTWLTRTMSFCRPRSTWGCPAWSPTWHCC